ncbi:MAG TPA: phosphoenolpyruvate--protein phosphotransferase [Candidatus Sulfomarinibacteraceae bacterium]|nr:phosphoenolpyruvate--protein phosphotransferase [Candidatus Sulfomarinibacteraceae bacterium]
MVSIVIVSHSSGLAEGVRELASQMAQESDVRIAVAGGVDDAENPIGTDALKVHQAIEEVYSDDGVLVLMDLGSALLSAEMALEFLSEEQRANVKLCPAPLVEGAVAAVVQASVGASLDQVCAEAMGAMSAKQQQMPEPIVETADNDQMAAGDSEARLTIRNRLGLHARPAARFVATANRFEAAITVRKDQRSANAKSINQVATLGARQGDEIVVSAAGPDAADAVAQLEALVEDKFGEEEQELEARQPEPESAPTAPDVTEAGVLTGIPASPGIAIGPAVHYRQQLPEVHTRQVNDTSAEWQALLAAIKEAQSELQALQERVTSLGDKAEADIFDAHALILDDPDLLDAVRRHIFEEKLNAAAAWQQEIEDVAREYRAIEDDYMRARADDVLDAGRRVLRHLLDVGPGTFELEEPAIILAADLTPSDTAQFDPELVKGICTELGGATSHSAILARAYGIPAVVGIGQALQTLSEGQTLALDGQKGIVWVDPDADTLGDLQERRAEWEEREEKARAESQAPAVTRDGQRIEVAANIGGRRDADVALDYGAEGVGLFRTEFLFLDREEPPSEEEQFEVYSGVAAAMGQRPIIIRTLDVGGDKPLPYLPTGQEENPFLGWRGLRFCLDRPDIFMPQLRAILRAAHEHNVKLMLPMVSTLQEIRAARALLDDAKAQLREEDLPFDAEIAVGIMIEVPAAVSISDQLAQEVDFFSIGTNDLTQYVMAADRGNAQVAELAHALHPAVLRMVQQTVQAAHEAGIWVGMCGELAGNALATPLLIGLGLDELSMSAPSIPTVKKVIRNLEREQAREIAAAALKKESAADVEVYLQGLHA